MANRYMTQGDRIDAAALNGGLIGAGVLFVAGVSWLAYVGGPAEAVFGVALIGLVVGGVIGALFGGAIAGGFR